MPVTLRAPSSPPSKKPVGVKVGEVMEDWPHLFRGGVLLRVEPTLEVDVMEVLLRPCEVHSTNDQCEASREVEMPIPDEEVEDTVEEEESGSAMSNGEEGTYTSL